MTTYDQQRRNGNDVARDPNQEAGFEASDESIIATLSRCGRPGIQFDPRNQTFPLNWHVPTQYPVTHLEIRGLKWRFSRLA
jgi:hypothetical protein